MEVLHLKSFKDYEKMVMLDLPEPEREKLRKRFDAIVNEFSALDTYDTDDIEPLVTVLDLNNIMREDISEKTITREDLLKTAPEQHNGCFQAPAAIK